MSTSQSLKTSLEKIPYVDLGGQQQEQKAEILAEVEKVLDSGWFILGPNVSKFEEDFAKLHGTKYAIGVANGTDSLFLSMRALGIGEGDEVITAPNSYLASASSIALANATPVFADVGPDYNLDPDALRKAITPKTKAIIPVHLTGRPANMDAIMEIAREHNLFVIEDCAQAVGATYKGQPVGSFGDTGSFSLHPLKNLAACGDGGVIVTNNEELYKYFLKARTHGHKNRDECDFWSYNSRLDALQAAILNVKMKTIREVNERRREIAAIYQSKIADVVWVPTDTADEYAVYHTFIIKTDQRDALQQYLADHNIDTKVHYPIPIHLQKAAAYLGYKKGDFPETEKQTEQILSLPVFPTLTDAQVHRICDTINEFFK